MLESAEARQGSATVAEWLAEGRNLNPHVAALLFINRSDNQVESAGPVQSAGPAGRPERVEQGSGAAGAVDQPVLAWPGPLSGREREVAILVARGQSNRAIGDELCISQATAARHVANIFAKLGLTSRGQLIAWVNK
jgi:DNA-binding NarL/FixJ family response regulator